MSREKVESELGHECSYKGVNYLHAFSVYFNFCICTSDFLFGLAPISKYGLSASSLLSGASDY